MKTWLYAAVASTALTVAASAASAATVTLSPTGSTFTGTFEETVNGSFTSMFTFVTPSAGIATASFEKTGLSEVNIISAFLNGTEFAYTSLFDAQFGASGPVSVSAGTQTVTITGNGTGVYTGSVGFAPRVVPGPIAGAGLPALMALGGFIWARRRKSQGAALPA